MNRRQAVLTLAATLCLLATALTAPLLARPAAAFGERVFEANPVAGAGDPTYPVYANATLAQSLRVTTTYLLESVTLRVQNDGGSLNALAVSIHPDDPTRHVPVMPVQLALSSQVTPNGAAGPTNYTFPFYPSALLNAGSTYWIVAENGATKAPPADGYAWVESNADSYPNGSAYLLDPPTGLWTGLPYDLFFSTYGIEYPVDVGLAVTANRTQAQPGDAVTFTVRFNNTGSQTSPNVWINDTLPTYLVNPVLSFPDTTPVSPASFPNLVFKNVTNGAHAFTITATVAYGTPPGTVLTNTATLAYEDATGGIHQDAPSSASLVVGLATKQLYLAGSSPSANFLTTIRPIALGATTSPLNIGAAAPLTFPLSPALARPFRTTGVTASLWIAIQHAPTKTLHLNLSLLDNNTVVASVFPTLLVTKSGYQPYVFGFPPMDATFSVTDRIRLEVWNLANSTDGINVAYNSTTYPARLDLTTTTYVSVDALALRNQTAAATIWSPLDPIVTWANVSDPFGASRIAGAWINITGPGNQVVASGAMGVLASDSSSLPAWTLFGFTLSPPVSTGRYRVDVLAMEDNGVVTRVEGFADVVLPVVSLANVPDVARARVGQAFPYYVYYNNTGTGAAPSAWLNDTLPAALTFVGSSLAPTSVSGSTYSWNLTEVAVGPHVLEVDVQVPGTSSSAVWVESRATFAYADTSGHLQPILYANASVFLNGPEIALTVTSAPSGVVHSNETIAYTIELRNVGDAAQDIWVNDTLPAPFAYVADTAALFGGTTTVSGASVRFHFTDMPGGTSWSFELDAAAGPALARGAAYVDSVGLNYTSLTGFLMPAEVDVSTVIAVAPWIPTGSVSFPVNRTGPGTTVLGAVLFANQGNEPASRAWVNLTLDARLTLVNASAAYSENGPEYTFALGAVPVGVTAIYLNLSVNDSTPDGTVLQVLGSVDYRDGLGNALPTFILAPVPLSVNVAVLSLAVTPTSPSMEAGVTFPLSVSVVNLGGGSTGDVWLNVTLPSSLTYYDDSSGLLFTLVGSTYSWHWTDQLPGPFVFALYLRPRETAPNGTTADLDFHVDYQGFDLRDRPGLDSLVHVTVVAPRILVDVLAEEPRVLPRDELTFKLQVQNAGQTLAAQVWLTDDVDPRLEIVSYNASVTASGTQRLTWVFSDIAPGEATSITLNVRVADGLQPGTIIPMALEVNYTNSLGIMLGHIRSTPTTVTVDQDWMPLVLVAVGGLAVAGFVLALRVRREKVEIEEVFLVYRDGVLISHLSRTLLREKDEDVLSGMLTAVQEFVREAFQYGEHRELQKLDFGEYRILIERGEYVYLAVVYSGEESPQVRKKVRMVIERIEDQFGAALAKWDGDMESVIGARDLIRDTLLGTANHKGDHNHDHAAKPPTPGR